MVRILMPALCLFLLAGCGHTRGNCMSVSRYHEGAASHTEEDGPYSARSTDNEASGIELSDSAWARRKARQELLGTMLELTGAAFAESALRRRNHPGTKPDFNDEVETLLYSTLIRIGVKCLREVTFDALSNR